jgi:hypothetical protein
MAAFLENGGRQLAAIAEDVADKKEPNVQAISPVENDQKTPSIAGA